MGHDGEIWQNVICWRKEWQTTSVFLPWEPHEEYEEAKINDTEKWPPQITLQYATGEEWRISSRKNEEMEPKWKKHTTVDVTGDGSKVWFCK